MDARELTKYVERLEDRIYELENDNKVMKQQIEKIQLFVGDILNIDLIGGQK